MYFPLAETSAAWLRRVRTAVIWATRVRRVMIGQTYTIESTVSSWEEPSRAGETLTSTRTLSTRWCCRHLGSIHEIRKPTDVTVHDCRRPLGLSCGTGWAVPTFRMHGNNVVSTRECVAFNVPNELCACRCAIVNDMSTRSVSGTEDALSRIAEALAASFANSFVTPLRAATASVSLHGIQYVR